MYSFLHFWPHPGFCKFQKQLHAIDPYSNHNCFLLFSHFIACSLGSCIRHCFQFQLNFFLISLWSPIPNGEEPSWFILALTNLGCHFQFAYLNIFHLFFGVSFVASSFLTKVSCLLCILQRLSPSVLFVQFLPFRSLELSLLPSCYHLLLRVLF